MDGRSCGSSCREAEVVGRGHPIDKYSKFVPTGNRIDEGRAWWENQLSCELADGRFVIKAAVGPTDIASIGQALQRLLDSVWAGQIQEVTARPYTRRRTGGDPHINPLKRVRSRIGHKKSSLVSKDYIQILVSDKLSKV